MSDPSPPLARGLSPHGPEPSDLPREAPLATSSATRLLFLTATCLVLAEWIIMFFLEIVFRVPDRVELFVDPIALASISAPILYFFLFRPMVQHIDERRKIETSLRASEERFRVVVENTPDAIFLADENGLILDANPQAARSLGLGPEELVGKSVKDIEVFLRQDQVVQLWQGKGVGGTFQGEGEHRRADGSTFPVEVRGQLLEWHGKPAVLAIARDVTERKQSEEELRYSEAKYVSVVENSLTGIFLYRNRRITFANRRFTEMSGYAKDELLRIPVKRLIHSKDWPYIVELGKSVLRKQATAPTRELRIITKSGKTLWLLLGATPVEYRDGTSLLGSALDISERKAMEQALAESRENLRQLSTQLMDVQEEERLRLAHELHDSVGQTLSAIQFGLETGLGEVLEDERRDSMQRLRTLVPKIRDGIEELHRISMGLRPSILDDLGLLPTISWFCREFQTTYPGICVDTQIDAVERDIPESLKLVAFRIIQEAMNNAARHSGSNRVVLRLRSGAHGITLQISDSGHGFDMGQVRSSRQTGRGFGLACMKERARQTKGILDVATGEAGTSIRVFWAPETLPITG